MAKDWASDVRKFAPDADDGVIAGIVRYCGIALQKPDSALVSYSDPVELGRVRNNFLKKKLALDHSDDALDAAIARVGERMKGDATKNRVTVYYLLLEDLGLTHVFAKKGSAATAGAAALETPLAVAGDVAAADASAAKAPRKPRTTAAKPTAAEVDVVPTAAKVTVSGGRKAAAPVAAAAALASIVPATAAAVTGAAVSESVSGDETASTTVSAGSTPLGVASGRVMPSVEGPGVTPGRFDGGEDGGKPAWGWLWLTLAVLAVIALFLLLPRSQRAAHIAPVATVAATTAESAENTTATAAPAIAPVSVPDGAGIVSETRAEKPVVKVYFDTGKAAVAPTFALAVEPLKAWLAANAGSRIGVSGYNDPSGNAAANAALSKRRAQAVQAALVTAGVAAGSIELIKPEAATDAKTTAAEARRVEVYIK